MSPVFEIIPEAIFFQQTNLICEISCSSFSYFFENEIEKKIYGLYVFHFNENEDIPGQLKEIFQQQPLLGKNFKKIFISFSHPESALLPEELYTPGGNEILLDKLFGDLHEGIVLTDLIANKKIYNIYRLPYKVHKTLTGQFPLATINHQYSLLINKQFLSADLIKIIFYENTFVTTVIKGGDLQIIQTYLYQSAANVVYQLKNICTQFSLQNVALHISGIIELNADLDKEIKHYFKNIQYDELPEAYEFSASLKEIPAHYFSHLFSLALCV